jgi:allantoinase
VAGPFELVIRAPRAILSKGQEVACAIGVNDGRIAAVEASGATLTGRREMELSTDVVLMPGLVDTHVHACEPGNTEWEGFDTSTRAAAAGGITTLVDMPLDSVPSTVTVSALHEKRTAARGQCHIDVGFWGGLVPGHLDDMASSASWSTPGRHTSRRCRPSSWSMGSRLLATLVCHFWCTPKAKRSRPV